jgi:hypothetical protein
MSVRKRTWTTAKGEKKEAWIVDYVDQDGDRHIETFKRKKEADVFHAQVGVDVRAGTYTAPSKSITVKEAAEDWIRSVALDHLLRVYANYYNRTRTHVSLNKDSPASRAAESFGHILPVPILGGLHHQYVRI